MKVNMKMTWGNYQRKDRRQLFKECARRGIKMPVNSCREELILAIHAYDAFHNGMDVGIRRKENEPKPQVKRMKYNFDLTDYNSEEYHLSLTDDQIALLHWLINNKIDLSYGCLEKAEPINYVEI